MGRAKLKRIVSAVLAVCLTAGCAGCKDEAADKDTEKETETSVSETATTTAAETTAVTTTTTASATVPQSVTTSTTASATAPQSVTTPKPVKPDIPDEPSNLSLPQALKDKSIGDITVFVPENIDIGDWVEVYERQGGTVTVERTLMDNYYNTLAANIISGKNVDLAYGYFRPVGVKQQIYVPITEYVDLKSERWQSVSSAAENFRIDGELYAVPIETPSAYYVCYNMEEIENNGYDDPYELWKEGEWTFDVMAEIMEDYVSNNHDHAGAAGSITDAFCGANSTGLFTNQGGEVVFSGKSCSKAMNALAKLSNGVLTSDWYGSASDAFFDSRCLFYIMGEWSFSWPYSPKGDDNWRIVPVPSLDGSEATACRGMVLMAANLGENSDNIAAFLECARETQINQKYIRSRAEAFAKANPYWSEEMLDVKQAVESSRYKKVYDFSDEVMSMDSDKFYSGLASWFEKYPSWEKFIDSYKTEFDKALY